MGSFWDKLNKAADNLANQFNDAMGTGSYQNGSSNAYTDGGYNGQNGQGGQSGGLFDSLLSGFGSASQNSAFCNYFEKISNGTDLNSVSESERASLMKNALEYCGADKTPNTTLGQIYPIIKRQYDEYEKNTALPTAHSTCPSPCGKNRDKCEKCLKRRLATLEALYYIDQPEEYRKRFNGNQQNQSKPHEMKCSLCGAPITSSAKVCEYCDTPVSGTMDNQSSYLSFTEYVSPEQAAYDLIYEAMTEDLDKADEVESKKIMTAILTANYSQEGISEFQVKMTVDKNYQQTVSLQKAKMTMADIRYMANEYNISVSEYLRGLFEGDSNLQTAAIYKRKKQAKEEIEKNRQDLQKRSEEHQQKLQDMRDTYERQKKLNHEYWEHRRASTVVAEYSGGVGGDRFNCGHCVNFVDGYCAYHRRDTNANDRCGNYRLR